ncbi:hypothetical protein GQ55_4G044300 [Panicum hallii var. hallii]|uniref:Uncharacterized protein n=1 Tax=Panicum hallii var. hallii TaxID=1504633 RepID=A0A2T7DV78_9POAL|nr:hypothetical protein GQ55_4G044300 [Panicum hallii var. hallii]
MHGARARLTRSASQRPREGRPSDRLALVAGHTAGSPATSCSG